MLPDKMIDDYWVGWVKQRVQALRYLGKFHSTATENLFHVFVTLNEFALLLVLNLKSNCLNCF